MNTQLSITDANQPLAAARLKELESQIYEGLQTFVKVGNALAEIQQSKLYAATEYTTFEQYLAQKWRIGRNRAYQQIAAANIVNQLPKHLPEPNEAQAAKLCQIKSQTARAEIWQQITQSGEKITAKKIALEVDKHLGKPAVPDEKSRLRDIIENAKAINAPKIIKAAFRQGIEQKRVTSLLDALLEEGAIVRQYDEELCDIVYVAQNIAKSNAKLLHKINKTINALEELQQCVEKNNLDFQQELAEFINSVLQLKSAQEAPKTGIK